MQFFAQNFSEVTQEKMFSCFPEWPDMSCGLALDIHDGSEGSSSSSRGEGDRNINVLIRQPLLKSYSHKSLKPGGFMTLNFYNIFLQTQAPALSVSKHVFSHGGRPPLSTDVVVHHKVSGSDVSRTV